MSDLLSYSIMLNGDKAVSYGSPHYAVLEPKLEKVTLPPLHNYVTLTENNLNSLNKYLQRPVTSSATPSLTSSSSSSASESPVSSPWISKSEVYKSEFKSDKPDFGGVKRPELPAGVTLEGSHKKRRQRLGPSCDSCRARKVKCNAEVLLLSRNVTAEEPAPEFAALSEEDQKRLLDGAQVEIGSNLTLVLSNQKLVKFEQCTSCVAKGLQCCFSKGFTKEDIINNKRSGDSFIAEFGVSAKVAKSRPVEEGKNMSINKANPRKSSCGACRKKKVRCEMLANSQRCVGCTKKDICCSFESS